MSLFDFLGKQENINEGVAAFRGTPGAVLLDVRSPGEYAEGHIPDSVNLPLNRLPTISSSKSTPLFIYCYSGSRSRRACAWLSKNGYSTTDIGGIMNYRGAIV